MTDSANGHAFLSLVSAARARGVKLVLFGGFALPVHGVERSTLDIDFLICDDDLEVFAEAAVSEGYGEVLRTTQYAKYRHALPEVLDIDTVFVDRTTIESVWADGRDEKVFGTQLRCASLDMMLGTKLHAIRYNEANRGRRDFDDIVELLAANVLSPHGERFRQLCRRLRHRRDPGASMPRTRPEVGETGGIRLPVLDGDTLPPKRLGIEGFCRAMEALYPVYPNREALLAKRRTGERGPVPVRFHVD